MGLLGIGIILDKISELFTKHVYLFTISNDIFYYTNKIIQGREYFHKILQGYKSGLPLPAILFWSFTISCWG